MVCFSVASRESFEGCAHWVQLARSVCPEATVVLCGLKTGPREVAAGEGHAAARGHHGGKACYLECDARGASRGPVEAVFCACLRGAARAEAARDAALAVGEGHLDAPAAPWFWRAARALRRCVAG